MRSFSVFVIVLAIIVSVFLPTTSYALIIGPYSGEVLDSQTDKPICGASFFIYWIKYVRVKTEWGVSGYSEPMNPILIYTDPAQKLIIIE